MISQHSVHQALRQQETLRQVIESISSELQLEPLLTSIVRYACELLGADRGTIGLVDPVRNVVRTEAAYHMPPDELGAEMSPGVGLAGTVLLTQQPLVLNRYGDLDNPTQAQLAEDSVVGVPILWRERMIGFFGIGAAPPRQFSAQDVETLALFARHAAIAIENARLFEAERRRAAQADIINRIGQLITSSLSLSEILQTAVRAIFEHLKMHSVEFLMPDPDEPRTLVLAALSSIYAQTIIPHYRQSFNEGLVGRAARTQQRILCPDVHSEPGYIPVPGGHAIVSELVVPVLRGDELLGVLNVESLQALTEEDAQDLQTVADRLGIAIYNARLFEQMQRTLEEIQLLYATSTRIGAAMDIDGVVEAYLEQVATQGRYTCSVVLYEFDGDGNRTAVIVHGHWSQADGLVIAPLRIPYTRDALDPLLDAGQTVTMSNVHTDPRASPGLRQIQSESKRPALAMIPLFVRGQRIGLVILSYLSAYEWHAADLQPYQATAAQLATAIDSRRQYRLVRERSQEVAVLQERQRLARELHDSVTQTIFSITLVAQSIAPAWSRSPVQGEQRVQRLLDLSQKALGEMRTLLAELRPLDSAPTPVPPLTGGLAQVVRDGLVPALRAHLADVAQDGLELDLLADGYVRQSFEREAALFRITQEALNNVVKHAHAQHVLVQLDTDATAMHLTVTDDGVGFKFGSSGPHGGLGLKSMGERADALGGTVRVFPVAEGGTTVEVTLPAD